MAAEILKQVFGTDDVSFTACSTTVGPGGTCTDATPVIRSVLELLAGRGRERGVADLHRHSLPESSRDRRSPRTKDRRVCRSPIHEAGEVSVTRRAATAPGCVRTRSMPQCRRPSCARTALRSGTGRPRRWPRAAARARSTSAHKDCGEASIGEHEEQRQSGEGLTGTENALSSQQRPISLCSAARVVGVVTPIVAKSTSRGRRDCSIGDPPDPRGHLTRQDATGDRSRASRRHAFGEGIVAGMRAARAALPAVRMRVGFEPACTGHNQFACGEA